MTGQLAWGILILAVVVATMFTSTAGSPSVIGHNSILNQEGHGQYNSPTPPSCLNVLSYNEDTDFNRTVVVEPRQELCGVPVGVWCFPVSIRPDHLRSVPTGQCEDKGPNVTVE